MTNILKLFFTSRYVEDIFNAILLFMMQKKNWMFLNIHDFISVSYERIISTILNKTQP